MCNEPLNERITTVVINQEFQVDQHQCIGFLKTNSLSQEILATLFGDPNKTELGNMRISIYVYPYLHEGAEGIKIHLLGVNFPSRYLLKINVYQRGAQFGEFQPIPR